MCLLYPMLLIEMNILLVNVDTFIKLNLLKNHDFIFYFLKKKKNLLRIFPKKYSLKGVPMSFINPFAPYENCNINIWPLMRTNKCLLGITMDIW
jgi:hypothetical protein